jgi:hypothetical protein
MATQLIIHSSAVSGGGGGDSRQKPKQHTVFLIDWDDTLFPTTALTSGSTTDADWSALEPVLKTFLIKAMAHGRVYIVTNSQRGWVESSVARHLPRLTPLMNQIPIMSARSAFERVTNNNPTVEEQTRWKFLAMLAILKREVQTMRTIPTLVQIGDSSVERNALLRIAQRLQPDLPPVKSIQVVQQPTSQVIVLELQQLTTAVPALAAQHDTLLDVHLSP